MHAVLKSSLLGILSYIVYNYIVIPLSMPEMEDFRKHSGNNLDLDYLTDKTIFNFLPIFQLTQGTGEVTILFGFFTSLTFISPSTSILISRRI